MITIIVGEHTYPVMAVWQHYKWTLRVGELAHGDQYGDGGEQHVWTPVDKYGSVTDESLDVAMGDLARQIASNK